MASALVFTHDRHRNEHMKKGPKLNKVDAYPSEESPYLKRKSMSLNQDGIKPLQPGGGSTQTLTIASLSSVERRDLRKKLKLDLVEVKRILTRIEARLEYLQQEPLDDRRDRGTDLLKQCGTLLKKLMGHKHAWVFNKPVDAEDWGILDYYTVIKKPMDLGTVKKKLESGYYTSPTGMADDVRLTFSNAMTYNPPGNDVYVMASTLGSTFEKLWKDIARKLVVEQQVGDSAGMVVHKDGRLNLEQQGLQDDDAGRKVQSNLPRSRQAPVGRAVMQAKPKPTDVVKRPMTFEEKEKLSKQMESLPEEKLVRVIEIMRKRHPEIGEDNDEVEVDIESIDNETLWELERFISNYMKSKGKKAKVASGKTLQTSQVDNLKQAMLINALGHSLTGCSLLRCEDAGEEDVDIDDDLAPAQFAPVEIDKDGVGADGEGSSSGDSSDSGSGSSDSDSDSSSGSESEAEDAQGGGTVAKAVTGDKV
ncbi:unnamed protein product [Sphagnum jensenii]|uniref:Uncharacterized protein n=1 Tax=Sphagnum jensenii TaxID=128206 RepID=A0ABP1AF88_9BRYO